MGVATILEAREILLLATGEHKAEIIRRTVEGEIDHEIAATFLQRHPDTTFYLDGSAAAALTRFATPWRLGPVAWTPDLTVRAVCWLSREAGKAILKLTQRDYAEHGLSALVAQASSPGALNGQVFNALGAKIRGRSRLPEGQRIICFSPHPDDDVISMGGILAKLAQNGNAITVAYMTSGNLAVFDHDVRRHADFIRTARVRGEGGGRVPGRARPADRGIPCRQAPGRRGHSRGPGPQADHPRVGGGGRHPDPGPGGAGGAVPESPLLSDGQGSQGPDRAGRRAPRGRAPARGGSASGVRGRRPLRPPRHPPDVQGGHRSGPRRARVRGSQRPEVWLYRGAWQEWPVTDATWLVPLSQEELRLKVQAIFKHQSQKDTAPFPGPDEREFWQRVEARNKGTAADLDRLGLAEYFAMEAYVVEG